MSVKFANYSSTVLSGPLTASATQITVASVATFPSSLPGWNAGSDWFYITLIDQPSYALDAIPPGQREVMKVTAVSGTVCTVVRGADNSIAQSWDVGAIVEIRVNASAINDLVGSTAAAGSASQIQVNTGGVLGGIAALTYDASRGWTQPTSAAPLFYSPTIGQSHNVGFMQTPLWDFSATTTATFLTPFNVQIGYAGNPIPAGSKANFGGYECNYETNTTLADTNGFDGFHAFAATMTNHGGSPMQLIAGVHVCDTVAGTTMGMNYNYQGGIAGGTHFGVNIEALGSQPGTTAFNVISSTVDPNAKHWTAALDAGGNPIVGITQIVFATAAGVATDYSFVGSASDLLRIYGGGSVGSGIFYSKPANAGTAGVWRFRDNPVTSDVDKVTIDGSLGVISFPVAGGGIKIKEGSNARMGVAVLSGGTLVVSNTSVTTSTRILLSRSTAGGTAGHLSYTIIAATSFTINSSSGTDTSTIVWQLVEAL